MNLAASMTGKLDGQASAADLREAGRRELAALADLLGAAKPGDSVHGARRRIKQLRSLLRLLRPALSEAACDVLNASLREAADALAGHRRAEALVTAAAKLEDEAGASGFWRALAEANRAAHAADQDPARSLAAAQSAIAAAAESLGSAALVPDDGDVISRTFLSTYHRARKRLRRGLRSRKPAELHEARKFVIHHLHHLRLLYPVHERRLAELEQLREMLGDLNDLDELKHLASGVAVAWDDARRMKKAQARLVRRAGKAAERLFRHKPAGFARRLGETGEARSPRRPVALQAGE